MGSPQEAWLIQTFYNKKRGEYLQSLAIAAASRGAKNISEIFDEYESFLFPWTREKKVLKEKMKKELLDIEAKKKYQVTSVDLDPNAMKRRKNQYGFEHFGD